MTKGQKQVMDQSQLKLKKINLIIGVHVEKVQNNLFVMDHIKVQNLLQLHTKLKKQKKCFFVLVNKLTTSHFVMVHITNKGMTNILDLVNIYFYLSYFFIKWN